MSNGDKVKSAQLNFDIRNPSSYKRSLQQLRRYAVQTSGSESAPVEIAEIGVDVKASGNGSAQVKVFMLRSSRYIIGFRGGADQVYALKDSDRNSKTPQVLLEEALNLKGKVEALPVGVSHGELGTYGSTYTQADWAVCYRLAQYPDGMRLDDVKRTLSLLVCLIAEASRFTSVGGQCGELLEGRPFRPDKGILTSFGKASDLDNHLDSTGLTLKELCSLRASVVNAQRKILRALHLTSDGASLKNILNCLYGRPAGSELGRLRDEAFIRSDVNFRDAIETLLTNCPKMIAFVAKRPSGLSAEQVDKVAALVEKLSDADVKSAAANLA